MTTSTSPSLVVQTSSNQLANDEEGVQRRVWRGVKRLHQISSLKWVWIIQTTMCLLGAKLALVFNKQTFSPDSQTFDGITKRFRNLKKITLDCLRLNDSTVGSILGPHIEELILLKCCSRFSKLFTRIPETCPNLRVLTLEISGFIDKFAQLMNVNLASCRYLESLRVKVRGGKIYNYSIVLVRICILMPQTVRVLKLEPASGTDISIFLSVLNTRAPITPADAAQTLTHISLVLDKITDDVIQTIARCLPLLTELDLKDRPEYEPFDDLSDLGVQSLVGFKYLTSLSLIRNRQRILTSFKRVTDMGMFLLSEGCKGLESVRLGGFSKVSDAGFTSIFNACLKLKKFEIQNAFLLTDLTFQDVSKVPRSLVEVKLVSCSSITSEAVSELATCSLLEVLDLLGCRSVADSCLNNVSRLDLLTCLNLGGADVTDVGMKVLGTGNAPIACLSLRGCKRVTDKGIMFLLRSEGKISKNLSSLDLGHMPGITDNAIATIADVCAGLTELFIRNCFHVTDASVKTLAFKGRLRRLDLYNCTALSAKSFEFLKKPLFRGLQWIGIGRTRMLCGDVGLAEIYDERPWLFICADGCEVGCHDGWQYHIVC
ncbi:F-box domain, cyclin-like protein [Artemisia annua]|uniref:F-box domain, cyclin-like protein n=1 Tax=Artemisia annua TaxID=35608 RepID=A0A2U1NSK9_ARTAN|nr:F-box domain, cyclin-like protein [Artemisia annua]